MTHSCARMIIDKGLFFSRNSCMKWSACALSVFLCSRGGAVYVFKECMRAGASTLSGPNFTMRPVPSGSRVSLRDTPGTWPKKGALQGSPSGFSCKKRHMLGKGEAERAPSHCLMDHSTWGIRPAPTSSLCWLKALKAPSRAPCSRSVIRCSNGV